MTQNLNDHQKIEFDGLFYNLEYLRGALAAYTQTPQSKDFHIINGKRYHTREIERALQREKRQPLNQGYEELFQIIGSVSIESCPQEVYDAYNHCRSLLQSAEECD